MSARAIVLGDMRTASTPSTSVPKGAVAYVAAGLLLGLGYALLNTQTDDWANAGAINPPKNVNTVLYVPNAPGHFVREKYKKGEGIYGCVSVDHDATGNAKDIVLAIAKAVGSCRAGVVEMTFQHECEGDNFEEQILYGGAIHLMKMCFQTMVDNGYPPSFAYAKAIRSLRSVIDVMDEVGIEDGNKLPFCSFESFGKRARFVSLSVCAMYKHDV